MMTDCKKMPDSMQDGGGGGCTCYFLHLQPGLPGLAACNPATGRQRTLRCLDSRLRPLSAQIVLQHCHSYLFVSDGVLILSASTWAPWMPCFARLCSEPLPVGSSEGAWPSGRALM